MGNRSHVIFPEARVAVYLHWNGGVESVVAFLDYMNERKLSCESYGAARFCQIVGNYFGGNLSLGVRGCGRTPSEHRALADEDQGAFVIARSADGLAIARWYLRNGSVLEGQPLAERIERARAHPYNIKGEMLTEIRARNAHALQEA